jgi:glycerophosphoryl diester phosphodiesterase
MIITLIIIKVMTIFSACDNGTEMLEIDCHITRDGEVVVSHDNDLQRCCGQEGLITDTEYKVRGQVVLGNHRAN